METVTPSLSTGPSPRAWGTLLTFNGVLHHFRSIPTCVGNTSRSAPPRPCSSVHPHVRGEHRSLSPSTPDHDGPSPRAWGTPVQLQTIQATPRSIPTCVGNTLAKRPAPSLLFGPSPRAWGTRKAAFSWRLGQGGLQLALGPTVHPHVRGEHIGPIWKAGLNDGPSPRAWGTRRSSSGPMFPTRSIPTCVGNTFARYPGESPRTVHPHVRGEHKGTISYTVLICGPSPRAWEHKM